MASIDKLSLVIHSGDFSRIHYALVLAAAAAATGKPATLFFAGESVQVLKKRYRLPDEDHRIKAMRVAGFEELAQSCKDLGVRMLVCETALTLADLKEADLRDDLNLEITGAVTFLADTSATGSTMFV